MATHSGTLAWRVPWMQEPGGLQSMESQRVGHSLMTRLWQGTYTEAMQGALPGRFLSTGVRSSKTAVCRESVDMKHGESQP